MMRASTPKDGLLLYRERERESLGEIFEAAGGQAKSDLVETRIAAKREYRSYENYA